MWMSILKLQSRFFEEYTFEIDFSSNQCIRFKVTQKTRCTMCSESTGSSASVLRWRWTFP